jgi:hypothetical protein
MQEGPRAAADRAAQRLPARTASRSRGPHVGQPSPEHDCEPPLQWPAKAEQKGATNGRSRGLRILQSIE